MKVAITMFSEAEKVFLKSIGINANFDTISDDEFATIEEKVSEHLQKRGFDEEYEPTKEGLMCESILDKLP
ncbi:MAG: hypothetical protein E7320_02025 [Clostridiales bacterium]|nr:hypothetical protein [Clostridiales bacterium]